MIIFWQYQEEIVVLRLKDVVYTSSFSWKMFTDCFSKPVSAWNYTSKTFNYHVDCVEIGRIKYRKYIRRQSFLYLEELKHSSDNPSCKHRGGDVMTKVTVQKALVPPLKRFPQQSHRTCFSRQCPISSFSHIGQLFLLRCFSLDHQKVHPSVRQRLEKAIKSSVTILQGLEGMYAHCLTPLCYCIMLHR